MPTVPHRAGDYLKTPEAIAAYLNVVLDDPESDHEDLMVALRPDGRASQRRRRDRRRVGTLAPDRLESGRTVPRALGAEHADDRHGSQDRQSLRGAAPIRCIFRLTRLADSGIF